MINNDGGGIFHFLPVSGETDAFEEHVATPTAWTSPRRPRSTAWSTRRADRRASSTDAIARPGIVEVRTDRAENLALHRGLADAALAAVRALKVSPTAPAASPAA